MSSVPHPIPDHAMRGMAAFLAEAGYTEAWAEEQGFTTPPWRGNRSRALLEHCVPAASPLGVLVRLFHFGEQVDAGTVKTQIPAPVIDAMVSCGIVGLDPALMTPLCSLAHFDGMPLAFDSVRRLPDIADLVLGVTLPTRLLARCLMLRGRRTVLDLCTGCGSLALLAARRGAEVIASDINPRAVAFAEFNSALNGTGGVTFRCGDRFAPVEDKRFDLIACNPPFFLNPKARLLYTDNAEHLDSFVEGLARAAPRFLDEGGVFQMLCEWAELRGESWESRMSEWFRHSGCDVLVYKAYDVGAAGYALKRSADSLSGEETDDMLRERVEYLARNGVEKIHGGLLTMRRRTGSNWIAFRRMAETPKEPIGDLIAEQFATQDVLVQHPGPQILSTKPLVAGGVRLIQESHQHGTRWNAERLFLEREGTITGRLAFDTEVADLVALLDGTRTVESLVAEVASKKSLPPEAMAENLERLVRRLAELGLIRWD